VTENAKRVSLTVVSGSAPGRGFILPPGPTVLGRASEADVMLADPSVSRLHAEVVAGDTEVVIRDLGSSNGTFVNGDRLTATTELRNGDEVRAGTVVLRFAAGTGAALPRPPGARPATQPGSTRVGDVHGAVQTGAGQQWNVGRDHHAVSRDQYLAGRDQHVAGRDQHIDHRVNLQNDYDPWDEIWQGRGVGRVLMIVGGLLAVAGFAMLGAFIVSDIVGDPFAHDNPFLDVKLVGEVPLAIAGLISFSVGGLLAGIGGGMSKAARKRADQAMRDQRR
jgi:hypothetical protein